MTRAETRGREAEGRVRFGWAGVMGRVEVGGGREVRLG